MGCWAHARRRAFDALSSDEPRALVLIGFIGLLYEAHLLGTDPKTGLTDGARRKAEAEPVIDQLYAWIAAERSKVDDDAPIAKARGDAEERRSRGRGLRPARRLDRAAFLADLARRRLSLPGDPSRWRLVWALK